MFSRRFNIKKSLTEDLLDKSGGGFITAPSQLMQDVQPMLVYSLFNVTDREPTVNQHWVKFICFLGYTHYASAPFSPRKTPAGNYLTCNLFICLYFDSAVLTCFTTSPSLNYLSNNHHYSVLPSRWNTRVSYLLLHFALLQLIQLLAGVV